MDEKTLGSDEVTSVQPVQPSVVVAEGSGKTAQVEGAKTKTVYNAELFAAIQESPIPRWSKESRHLYFSIFIAFCCACANGYDGSLMTAILGMDSFQARFHSGSDGPTVSIIMSLYSVGSMVGAPFAAILTDRFGRRVAMFCGSVVIIIGMIISASAGVVAQLVVGRFVLGLGVAVLTVSAPAYSIEIAPPHWRGRCTGFYNCGWFGGSIPAAAICFGCNFVKSDWGWRVPLILQAFACVIVMCTVWFIPESPRWQMANGREEEAIAFLVKYHGANNPESRLVLLEVDEMREAIRQDGADKSNWNYGPLFMTHNGRWRVSQVLMIGIFGQFSGNGLGYFNTTIFANMGVNTSAGQLGYNLLNSVLSAAGALTAVRFTDRMPRRRVLVWGTLACATTLLVNAALNEVLRAEGTHLVLSYEQGALACYFLFNIVNSFTYTPLQGVLPTEALDTQTRAKGLALYGFAVSGVGFINLFCTPIALANIQNRYIWVFVVWDLLETVAWYFFCVESQGRTIEQLEWVYEQPNPVKASLKADKVIVQADGLVSEKVVVD